MPLDGIFLHNLTNELQSCVGCRADKIHQPSKEELVILLRSASLTGKLLISVRSGSARLHLTSGSFDNPPEPPAFCKLLRRHLSSAKITEISQDKLDRTVRIRFMTYNEMGDTIYPFLVIELITGRANVILCSEDGRILDALRRSDIETSARLVQPGARYLPPEKETKLDPLVSESDTVINALLSCRRPLREAFTAVIDGVSPLVSRELAAKTGCDPDAPASDCSVSGLKTAVEYFRASLKEGRPVVIKTGGEVKDFCYMPIGQYGDLGENIPMETYSQLLDRFYADRDTAARMRVAAQDIIKLVANLHGRTARKLSYRTADLEKCKDREQYRIYGELIKANLYAIEKGARVARVQNYYDEGLAEVDIPLDPALSPSANAAKYFKEYKKTYTAEQTLTGLIDGDKKELLYLESVQDALTRASTAAELEEIRAELTEAGYIRPQKGAKKRPAAVSRPKEFLSPSGLKILVGKNNKENDLLTLKTAGKNDIWFHTKNIPGSHVVLFSGGKEVTEADLLFAASLAAGHSKASDSDNVPVDFTEVKNVKKPSGAKPGMVIYSANRTIYAKPFRQTNI